MTNGTTHMREIFTKYEMEHKFDDEVLDMELRDYLRMVGQTALADLLSRIKK